MKRYKSLRRFARLISLRCSDNYGLTVLTLCWKNRSGTYKYWLGGVGLRNYPANGTNSHNEK